MATEPAIEHVLELKEYLEGHFSKQKVMIKEMRLLRALLHPVDVPPEYENTTKVVRTPILADMIQRIVATLTVNYPTWVRGLMGDRPKDEYDSSLIEKWLVAGHQRMELQARRRTFRMLIDSAVADGMAVCQYQWLPQAWSPFPRRNKNEHGEYSLDDVDPYMRRVSKHVRERPFPFSWRDIDPLTYYFWDGYDGEREVLLIEAVPLAPTAARLNVQLDGGQWVQGTPGQPMPENSVSGESVELVQHLTKHGVTYVLDGRKAKHIDLSRWGRLGIFDFAGLSTHERAPDRAFLPIAFALTELVPFLDRLLTMKANWMYLHAFPRSVLQLAAPRLQAMHKALGDAGQRAGEVTAQLNQLNGMITLQEGESFGYALPANVGGDLNQLIQLTMGLVNQAGIASVLRGESPTADSTGYLANQLMTAARLAYDPITDNCKFMLHDGAEFLLYGVDKLANAGKTGVPVWGEDANNDKNWLTLSSKEIDGIYDTEPRLDPLLPSNLIMEGRFGLEQVQTGAISMYTHRSDFLHRAAPEEEEYRILLEKAKQQIEPQLIQEAGEKEGILPKPPAQQPALVDQFGQPMGPSANMGNVGMPVTPGQGMSLTGEQVVPGGVPALPGAGMPGPGPGQNPGGSFGQQAVTNVAGA